MAENYENILKQLKKGYQISQEMLESKEEEKRKIKKELVDTNKEIKDLSYDVSILKYPRKRTKTILKKNGLGKDLLALLIGIILAFIGIPSLTYLLAVTTSWELIISQALAILATIFIPGYIIYSGLNLVKDFQKTTDDLIDADILLKEGSLEKSENWLKEKIKQREILNNKNQELEELIATLKGDINAYVVSYNTINSKLINSPLDEIKIESEKDLKLTRKIK